MAMATGTKLVEVNAETDMYILAQGHGPFVTSLQ